MTVLVTGGAGYIGSHTIIELIKSNDDVVIVDNFSNSQPEVIHRLEQITGRSIPYYEIDVLDDTALDKIFETHDISSVIHFAALKAVGESVQKPLTYYHNNLTGLIKLLQVMKLHEVKNIVFSSSATVYGLNHASPLTEDLSTDSATNPYGWTKIMSEQILMDLSNADSDWSITLLRYFNPIGAHESGMIGEDPKGVPNNLMPYITQVAIGKREELSVFGNDYPTHDGTGVRDYIHVVDLAYGHVLALNKNIQSKGVSIYNLGTGEGYSVLDLVHTFSEVNNVSIPYKITERRAGDVAICYADPTKARQELGWTATRNLSDMCRDSWHWQEKNPQGYES